MNKKSVICLGTLAVLLPFIVITIALILLKINIYDNPDFWYAYMAYLGTVLLATVALYQNVSADEVNKRLMEQQLRQKIGYFDLEKKQEQIIKMNSNREFRLLNQYRALELTKSTDFLGTPEISRNSVLQIWVKNVGEDVILNLKIISGKINGEKVYIPCSATVIYKEEAICLEIDNIIYYQTDEMLIEISLQLENVAGIVYIQNIFINAKQILIDECDKSEKEYTIVETGEKDTTTVYYVSRFGSEIKFDIY